MHILEIPSFFTPYGGEFCLEQAKALKAVGHEVRILSNVQLSVTISPKGFFTLPCRCFEQELEGVTVCQSFQRGVPKAVRWNARRWVTIVCEMFDHYVARYGKPDILHAHCAKWAGYAAMQISRKYGIPYVITEHLSKQVFEQEFGPAPVDTWQIPLLKACYREAKMVVPVSEELVEDIACYFDKDYRWQAISNTIDTDFFHYQPRAPREGRLFRFCCLANFWPLKGYDVLIPAFRKLREAGCPVELHIAGRGTDSRACRSMLADGIVTHGLLDKAGVRALLYQSDALVLASRSETQGLVLLEAMSTGIPVVATEAIPKSIRVPEGGRYVPVDDVASFAEAMKETVEVSGFEGDKVCDIVRQMASPSVIAQRLTVLFNDVLSS
jgi:glycosyltransferase involved in cell wall biosynthesis